MTEVASAVSLSLHGHDETRATQTGLDQVEGRCVPAYEGSTNKAGEDPEAASQRALEKLETVSNRSRDEDNVQEYGHEDEERIPEEKEADEYMNEEEAAVLGSTDVEKASEKPEKSLSGDVMSTIATEQQPNDDSELSRNAAGVVDSPESVAKFDDLAKEDTTEPITESAPVHASEPKTEPTIETTTPAGPEVGKGGVIVEAESTNVADVTTAVADADATDGKEAREKKPVDTTSEPQHAEEGAEPTKEDESPVIAEHAAEPESSVPLAEAPDEVAREEDAVEASDPPVVEALAGGEDDAQPEESNADAAVEPSGLEPTKYETTKATQPKVEVSSDVPKQVEETAAQEASVKGGEAPVAGQRAEEEAPAPDATEDSALNAVGDAHTNPQETERTVELQVEVSDEVRKEAEEQAAEKNVPEAEDTGIGVESVAIKESEPTEIMPAAEGGKKPEEVVVAQAVETVTGTEPEVDALPPQAETAETNEVTARQKAASLENIASEKEAGAVETNEPETEEEPRKVEQATECQAPRVSEGAAAPALQVNEAEEIVETGPEAKEELAGLEASQEPESETIKPLEEVVNAPEEQARAGEGTALDAKGRADEAENIVEGTADETDVVASAELSSEPQVVDQLASSDAPGLEAQADGPFASAKVPSEEVTVVKEDVEDVSSPEPSEDAIAHTEDASAVTQEEASAPVEQVFVLEVATTETIEERKLDEAPVQVLPETDINTAERADKEPPAAGEVAISESVEQSAEAAGAVAADVGEQLEESGAKDISAEEVGRDVAIENVSVGGTQDVVEEGGVAEPAATPAAGKPVPSEGLATNIDQVDEQLEEESVEQTAVSQEGPAVEDLVEAAATRGNEATEIIEDAGIPASAEPAPQPETMPEAPVDEHDSNIAEDIEEQDVDVPDVSVETPTPMSETLTISSDEEDDAPFEERIAKAIGITPEETTKSPALDTSSEARAEDEVVTPTEAKDGTVSEVERREVPAIETGDLETPSQSVVLEHPVTEAEASTAGMVANAEFPERPKSPWTPSYSVATQGLSPMHPQPELPPITEDIPSVNVGESIEEKAHVEADVIPPASLLEEVQATDGAFVESTVTDTPALGIRMIPAETAPIVITGSEELTDFYAAVEQAPILATEDRAIEASDEVAAADDYEVPVETAPTSLSVDTSIKEVPERSKSPWTPSYSVTKMGPGVPEPEEFHLDQDAAVEDHVDAPQEIQQVATSEAPAAEYEANETRDAEEPTPDIERSKSPYPPAYLVTQINHSTTDAVNSMPQLEEPTSPISESSPASVVDSNEPEAPLTPRSDLGIVTPGFDTLSEVSESSHIPMPPSSPRSDPETSSLLYDEVKTPLVSFPENQVESVSPLQTPLMSANKALELTEQLTESVVSGFDADTADTSATGSWVKENSVKSDSRAEDSNFSTAALAAEGVDQPANRTVTTENDVATQAKQQNGTEIAHTEEPSTPPELNIPKLNATPASPAAQPLIVTNTLSTDSAYTQTSDALSPSQDTATTMTTPDVESPPISKLHPSSDLESEAATSDSTVRPLPNTPQKGKSLGVTHTLAMRSFPSAFTDSETSPAVEQSNQPVTSDTHEGDDLLSPLPADARRRLESTASSLAFPGGWVSSPRKERTSLEVATGEFSKPMVEGNLIVTPPSTERPSEEKESKWRCVIM